MALTIAALAAAALPPVAAAEDFGTDEPALDEYVESLPVAEGNRPAGHHGTAAPLSRSTQRALANTAHGRVLERVATSPAAGAPSAERTGAGTRSEGVDATGRRVRPAEVESASLASAVVDSAGGGTNLLVLVLLAAVAGVAVIFRGRRRA